MSTVVAGPAPPAAVEWLEMVARLATEDASAIASLMRAGALELALRTLSADGTDARATSACCDVVWACSAAPACSGADAGSASVRLVAALASFAEDAGALRAALRALCSLSARHDEAAAAAATPAALASIASAMEAHWNAGLQAYACGVLFNVASRSSLRPRVADLDGRGVGGCVRLLVEAMHAHAGAVEVQRNACGALCCLSAEAGAGGRRTPASEAVLASGALGAVGIALRAHGGDADVAVNGLGTLLNMSLAGEGARAAARVAGAIPLAAGVLSAAQARRAADDDAVARAALDVLCSFASERSARGEVIATGVLPCAAAAARRGAAAGGGPRAAALGAAAVALLYNVSMEEAYGAALADAGAAAAAGALGRAHPDHGAIARHAAGLLINLSGYERRASRQDALCGLLA